MDCGPRSVVGFVASASEGTLNNEVANEASKLHTQRSLLSEMLAHYALDQDGLSDDDSDSEEDDDSEDDEGGTPIVRQDTGSGLHKSEPISIPISESFANQRAKDAYRRMLYQRQVEHLYLQQQQQAQQAALVAQQQRHLAQQQGPQTVQEQVRSGAQARAPAGALRAH